MLVAWSEFQVLGGKKLMPYFTPRKKWRVGRDCEMGAEECSLQTFELTKQMTGELDDKEFATLQLEQSSSEGFGKKKSHLDGNPSG